MLHFANDYMEGMHPLILKKLTDTNLEQTAGYGTDSYCSSAKEKIRKACECPEAQIYFLVGGTQTNAIAIKGLLRPWEGVLSADTGHINVHEAGAIESGGHKVLAIPQTYGKIDLTALSSYLKTFHSDETRDHMVWPGMVYISHPTEYGALYTRQELEELRALCDRYDLRLYLDGARLGYGLASEDTDVTLPLIARLCDAFYIGGTKVGAMFGEALVFPRPIVSHFTTIVKQEGALLAKGRLLGIQFDTLFTDDLYLQISRHALSMARLLKDGLKEKGYPFFYESPTNQQFLLLDTSQLELLKTKVDFSFWEQADPDHAVIRLATSWATTEENIKKLLALL